MLCKRAAIFIQQRLYGISFGCFALRAWWTGWGSSWPSSRTTAVQVRVCVYGVMCALQACRDFQSVAALWCSVLAFRFARMVWWTRQCNGHMVPLHLSTQTQYIASSSASHSTEEGAFSVIIKHARGAQEKDRPSLFSSSITLMSSPSALRFFFPRSFKRPISQTNPL